MQIIYGVCAKWDSPIIFYNEEKDAQIIVDKLNKIRGEDYYVVTEHHINPNQEILEAWYPQLKELNDSIK